MQEAPKAWDNLRKRAENLSSICVVTTWPRGDDKTVGKFTTKSRGHCKLFIEEQLYPEDKTSPGDPKRMRIEVFGMNDDYYFHLRAATREGPYKLVTLQKLAPETIGKEMPRDIFLRYWDSQNFRLMIQNEALPDIFRKPYFKLISVEPVGVGDEAYIRCNVGYEQPPNEKTVPYGAPNPYKAFQVDLDPKSDYGIRRVMAEMYSAKDKTTYVLTDELRETKPGEMGVYVYDFTSVDKSTNELCASTKYEYLEWSYKPPPKSDFYLSAFGLPEPPGVRKPGIPLFVWVGGTGLILVVCAFVLQRRWRKSG